MLRVCSGGGVPSGGCGDRGGYVVVCLFLVGVSARCCGSGGECGFLPSLLWSRAPVGSFVFFHGHFGVIIALDDWEVCVCDREDAVPHWVDEEFSWDAEGVAGRLGCAARAQWRRRGDDGFS